MYYSVIKSLCFNSSGSDGIESPHGIPVDLLDRLLIIRTLPYSPEEIKTILGIRAKTEGISISEEAAQKLSEIGDKTSLRYAIQLLTPSAILMKINGREEISLDEVEDVNELFLDSKKSATILMESKDKYIS